MMQSGRDGKNGNETAMLAQYIREKGIEQGFRQGKTDALIQSLEARFGGTPNWAMEKIEMASLTEIEKWSLRLLDSKSIEEVFNI